MSAEGVKRPLDGVTAEKEVNDAKRQVVLATKDTIKKQIEYYLSDKNLKSKSIFRTYIGQFFIPFYVFYDSGLMR